MGQRIRNQPVDDVRAGDDSQAWLASLVDAMETVSRGDVQASTCDPRLVSAVKRQLARPTAAGAVLRPVPVHRGSFRTSACGAKPFNI